VPCGDGFLDRAHAGSVPGWGDVNGFGYCVPRRVVPADARWAEDIARQVHAEPGMTGV